MLSKNTINFIRSLKDKKTRQQEMLFTAEGTKSVIELCHASKISVKGVFATKDWIEEHAYEIPKNIELNDVSNKELDQISSLKTHQNVLMIAKIPQSSIDNIAFDNGLNLVIDTVQDPGNLGTIIRIADWYGIKNIICSNACADAYNSKTIQASMASIARVNVFYADLKDFLSHHKLPVYGAVMDGQNLKEVKLKTPAFILIGNEGKGISSELKPFITHAITISKVGEAESLNAAIATAIICDRMIFN
jgi:TrmH family RNA methyltransferase